MTEFGTRRNFFERINRAFAGFVFTRTLPFPETGAMSPLPADTISHHRGLRLLSQSLAAEVARWHDHRTGGLCHRLEWPFSQEGQAYRSL